METLQKLTDADLSKLYFGMFKETGVATAVLGGEPGYTGEDGFEISVPVPGTLKLVEDLVADENVRLCGLGARDSLRLEAGLCLYGNDLSEEAARERQTWTIGKREETRFPFPVVKEFASKSKKASRKKSWLNSWKKARLRDSIPKS